MDTLNKQNIIVGTKQQILSRNDPIGTIYLCTDSHAPSGDLTPEELLDNLEGSASITVDLNEAGDKVQVKLDQDVVDDINSKASQQYVANYVAEQLVNKQDKLDSYSDHATVANNKLTINYKVRQEDGTYSDVPVEFTSTGGGGVTEERVQEMIDASIGDAIGGTY